ncbi:TerC family protein [Actimicrobium sp. CCI2.3]|uniref:TerC family protein n=1 Tax=Actimicrobium sp. CCI2.3 TaxID=3048616 RepID=UPI002AB48668|nr:hypothetical protein [Actimicrobium sp. CCI2.3]MDY7574083.1 hypothetical protein [Actimicrobium sp. CCI2.3]MEB0023929.1 hypothetical protein [Actimicrobium sp. CCI2.3]
MHLENPGMAGLSMDTFMHDGGHRERSVIGRDASGSADIANTKAFEFFYRLPVEKPLAVSNIFAFLLIFTHFAVPKAFQRRVLMVFIIGAIVLRSIMILLGGWLLAGFSGVCICSARS